MFSAEDRYGGGRLLLAAVAAVALPVAIWALAVAVGDPLLVRGAAGLMPVPLGAVVVAAVAAVIVALLLSRWIARSSRPRAAFTALAVVVLVATAPVPVAAALHGTTAAWLLLLHLAVAGPILAGVLPGLPARRRL